MLRANYQSIINGQANAELLVSNTGLSFWGGVNPANGLIIDQHHPLHNHTVTGKILAIPNGRGSSSGSGVILELLVNEIGPAALVFTEQEDILTLGVLVAEVMFERSIPIIKMTADDFKLLETGVAVEISNGVISTASHLTNASTASRSSHREQHSSGSSLSAVTLTDTDQKMLNGDDGKATQLAMQIVVKMAELQGAKTLIDVVQGHIDACVYNGPSSLLFAQRLATLGARVKIPTTLNSLSVDKRRWQQQGVNQQFGAPASELGDAYLAIGAKPSYTCAPYLLNSAPTFGQQIVWAESNAVMFANSVIGARTQKYPDFLDACIALTGRAPATGAHTDAGRMPSLKVQIAPINKNQLDDAFWPLLGYHLGTISQNDIPIVYGLEHLAPTLDNLKALSAAFATTSSVAMLHIKGITPEADNISDKTLTALSTIDVNTSALTQSWNELNSAKSDRVDMVCLGNPHFSATECEALATLCEGRSKHPNVSVVVTLGRDIQNQLSASDTINTLDQFGVQFINDTCWCMIEEPIIPVEANTLMTNSGKYAHYGPGLVNRPIHFASLADCVDAACSGKHVQSLPEYLLS